MVILMSSNFDIMMIDLFTKSLPTVVLKKMYNIGMQQLKNMFIIDIALHTMKGSGGYVLLVLFAIFSTHRVFFASF